MNKVHGPGLIDCCCIFPIITELCPDPSLRCFVPQLQAHFVIEKIEPIGIYRQAFALQHDMDTPIAIANARFGNLLDPLFQIGLIAANGFVLLGRTMRLHDPACAAFTNSPDRHHIFHQFAFAIRPQSFRLITSCSIALSRDRSANRRLRRAFSSSSCFKHFISDGIRPPNFLRQL